MNSGQLATLEYLFYRFCDNTISKEEMDKLNSLMLESEYIQCKYFDFIKTELALTHCMEQHFQADGGTNLLFEELQTLADYEKIAPAIETSKEELPHELIEKVVYPPREKREISKFSLITLALSTAAVLFLVLFARLVPPSYAIEVATLVDQIDVRWGNTGINLQTGDRLLINQSPINLKKGVLKIRYDNGVEAIIEAPATFALERGGIFLEFGRLYSRVSETGLGFRVQTPASQFIDLGTEFGVMAHIEGSTELHVITGKVQLFAGSKHDKTISQMVTAGAAVSYNADAHVIKSIQVDQHRFVNHIDSTTKTILRGYANAYQQAVAETKPVAWYRFEKGPAALGYDEISKTVTQWDSSEPVTFAEWPAIDFAHGNQSLRLSGDADSGVFISDKVVERSGGKALSISLWIRPEPGIDGHQNIICYTNHQKRTYILKTNQLSLSPDNHVYFYVYNLFNTQIQIPFRGWTDESRSNAKSIVLRSPDSLPLDQWSHLVASFSDKGIELYVNGRLCKTEPIPIRTEYHEGGYWGIGCATGPKDGSDSTVGNPRYLNYKGFINEISFYDRMLTAQEVLSLFETAMPPR